MTLPPDSLYTQNIAGINQQEQNLFQEYGNPYSSANASFQERYGYQGGQLRQGLGLTESGGIDVSTPYGQASLLQRTYQQGQRGTTNNMASRGQLYSGAHGSSLAEGTFQYQRGHTGLQEQLASGLHGIQQHALGQKFTFDTQRQNEMAGLIDRSTPPPAGPAPEGGGTSPGRTHPTMTTSHVAAGLNRIGTNTYIGPNGTYWHRNKSGTFTRGKP